MARKHDKRDAAATVQVQHVCGATLVGHALLHGEAEHLGARVQRVEHRCWTVALPGRQALHGIGARQAAEVVDDWLRS